VAAARFPIGQVLLEQRQQERASGPKNIAPLGEELLFRGLLLRALVRRMEFWPAAVVSGVIFGIAHIDQYVPYPLWPRTLTLIGTGVVLAWLYRWRGYWGSVAAHASVNLGAAIVLLVS